MAKFQSIIPNQQVSFDGGFIHFKNGEYTTTDKKQIEALRKANRVEEVGAKKAPPLKQEETK